MANPYTSGADNLDPFAEPTARGPTQAPRGTGSTASPTQPPGAPSQKPAAPAPGMEFYNPTPAEAAPDRQQAYFPQAQQQQQQQQATQPGAPTQAGGGPEPREAERAPPAARDLQTSKFWTLDFYKQFFDVDTKDVLLRMGNAMVPVHPPDFLVDRNWHFSETVGSSTTTNGGELAVSYDINMGSVGYGSDGGHGGEKQREQQPQQQVKKERLPDMYGPFWISTTLWMVLAIVGNIMSKIAHSHEMANRTEKNGTLAPATAWTYDFTQASVACVTIYSYCVGMSVLLWGLMKWKALPVSLLDTLCLYGYSMTTFLVAAILCAIPSHGFQWFVVIGCGLWSSAFLLINFWHVWKLGLEPGWFAGVVVVVLLFHMAITMSFKFYFFNYEF